MTQEFHFALTAPVTNQVLVLTNGAFRVADSQLQSYYVQVHHYFLVSPADLFLSGAVAFLLGFFSEKIALTLNKKS